MSVGFIGNPNLPPSWDPIIEIEPKKGKPGGPVTCIHCNKPNEYQDEDYVCWECKNKPL